MCSTGSQHASEQRGQRRILSEPYRGLGQWIVLQEFLHFIELTPGLGKPVLSLLKSISTVHNTLSQALFDFTRWLQTGEHAFLNLRHIGREAAFEFVIHYSYTFFTSPSRITSEVRPPGLVGHNVQTQPK